jgi:CubicO group peptidase (beta-lactamase class C family)
MPDDIESSFKAAIDAGQINGAVICATDTDGNFTYNQAFGERTLLSGEKRPQQLDDVIYLASATKIVTAIAALQCVEDGLLSLTGDLSTIAPELTNNQVLTGFSEDGETPLLEPINGPVTLEMLLTHSDGLNYYFLNPLIAQWREKFVEPNLQEGKKRNVEETFCYPLAFQPGKGWMYGPGLDWAGRIVERVTGLSLGERMQKRIFDPLDIHDAQFYPVSRDDLRERLVDLNPDDPDALGRAVVGIGDMNARGRGDFGGHGLFMSATSFAKILHAILVNDGTLLEPGTVDEMFQHRLGPEATASHQAALASPAGQFFRVGVDLETKCGFGLGGLLTLEDVDGWYGDRTLTWGGGMTLAWFIDRKNGLCGIGAPMAKVPLDMEVGATLKQVFRRDVYRKHAAWQKSQ